MRVKDIMDTTLNLVRTSDTFEHLIRTLDKVKYRVVFVVNREDKLVGIVTEADIIKVLVPNAENIFTTAIITLWFSAIASTVMANTILIASIIFMKGNM